MVRTARIVSNMYVAPRAGFRGPRRRRRARASMVRRVCSHRASRAAGARAERTMTYTVLARCERTGQVGVGIATASISFGGVGPICTLDGDIVVSQAYWNPAVGIDVARMITAGVKWEELLAKLTDRDKHLAYRQIGVVRFSQL